ncbi:U4/U6-U5 snRNP complex subunit PRP4 NDAI_0J00330 [Naumovozyma dairenensis CBS 421]|uniref:Uncharacterized protein n=1 Tax=Naumovozyma dairenensis (strain ATCC 10597 / BCRC 20456 / CBS 421 / NBRC 0211 / NRRL Y-12639) TaxID=1071378 RepID=G0WGJ7_NAUDC|nr:hypothetical protein NDAI_0J00330 [Naumovozyma dairenensis CBS 421]CCD26925.1 hypothetical protein NDAI_0J00330 [Naumovozyma dairenensis CBS 421]
MSKDKGVSLTDLKVDIDYKQTGQEESVGDALRRLEFQRQEKLHIVPVDDTEVRQVLRFLGEQEEKTNQEDNFSRRERLAELFFLNKDYLTKYKNSNLFKGTIDLNEEKKDNDFDDDDEEFYTPANESLIEARKYILRYSIDKSRDKLREQKEKAINFNIVTELKSRRGLYEKIKQIELVGSEVVSTRPVSKIRINSDGSSSVCGTWAGDVKILEPKSLKTIASLPSVHDGKIGGLDWNTSYDLIVSGAEDALVKLHTYKEGRLETAAVLQGHEGRVVNVKFHPSNKFIASASFDQTWRLWDVETGAEIQLQEGHAKEVYALGFQQDGALLCSGGLDNTAIIWDLRSGKSIMTLNGHAKPIYCLDWSPNGHEVATGGGDGLINIWDLRKAQTPPNILPAHSNIVSDLHYERSQGRYLVSCGYDRCINFFSSDSWRKICSKEGHTDKILSVDSSDNADYMLSSGWNRSIKLWQR